MPVHLLQWSIRAVSVVCTVRKTEGKLGFLDQAFLGLLCRGGFVTASSLRHFSHSGHILPS